MTEQPYVGPSDQELVLGRNNATGTLRYLLDITTDGITSSEATARWPVPFTTDDLGPEEPIGQCFVATEQP